MQAGKNPVHPVLIVDDELLVLQTMGKLLKHKGIDNTIQCSDSREVEALMSQHEFSVVSLDLNMPFLSGVELLEIIKQNYPGVSVIMVTASNEIDTAVECMRKGAFDFMVKPVEANRFVSGIRRGVEIYELQSEVSMLRKRMLSRELEHPEAFSEIITQSALMKSVFKYIEAIAPSSKPVLITGESGVGKELIARAVHRIGRPESTFVPVNVAGLDDTMFSDTLFGHKKGAFTGAEEARAGMVEQASDGTLFLDEIGDLDNRCQVKLLRLIQDSEYYPVGSDKAKIAEARIIAATNVDLQTQLDEGAFRRDLYYRLTAHHIHIPPLRERLEDLPFLIDHIIEQEVQTRSIEKPQIPNGLIMLLESYTFPGNIRELQSMITDSMSRSNFTTLSLPFLRKHIKSSIPDASGGSVLPIGQTPGSLFYNGKLPTLKDVEDFLIAEAMRLSGGKQAIAAQMLGISQSKVSRWTSRHDKTS